MTDADYLDDILAEVGVRDGGSSALELARLLWTETPDAVADRRAVEEAAQATLAARDALDVRLSGDTKVVIDNRVVGQRSTTTIVVVAPDSPFVTDSVINAFARDGLVIHQLNNVVVDSQRDANGRLQRLGPAGPDAQHAEVVIYAEVDPLLESELAHLQADVSDVLRDVGVVVRDFSPIRDRVTAAIEGLAVAPLGREEIDESTAFLEWLRDEHFVFLGYREFTYEDDTIRQVADSSLGILTVRTAASERRLEEQDPQTREFLLRRAPVAFSKSGTRSTVHRHAYPDYVGVKRFDADGRVIGEAGFLGLYTSSVYLEHARTIPIIREKIREVLESTRFDRNGFDGKTLAQVLATFPRDELFEADTDWINATATAVTYIHERRHVRVFVRSDPYGLFATCLVYVPRELFDTHARRKIQSILSAAFGAIDTEFELYFSESTLVRLQVVLRLPAGSRPPVDVAAVRAQIVAATRDWRLDLNHELAQRHGQSTARTLALRYGDALPAGYRDRCDPVEACRDIDVMEHLSEAEPTAIRLFEDSNGVVHVKVTHFGPAMWLSEIVPTLENLGFSVGAEHRFDVQPADMGRIGIQDFELSSPADADIAEIEARVAQTLTHVWSGNADDDGFNRLIVSAGLTWREADLLRAYARYMKQAAFGFSHEFIYDTLDRYPVIASALVRLYCLLLDPGEDDPDALAATRMSLDTAIETVPVLNEDRVLRRFVEVIEATVRTNYFTQSDGCLALKLNPARISGMPRPIPAAEIFVSSPSVEGVHLRNGPVARGGLRWSDRTEDYRTEVLGLVKAQVVKNAVIVPTGAKGGFVLRGGASIHDGYTTFVRGLLDVTDTIRDGEVCAPVAVRRRDGDDPYLVVAADKGTATMSDTANAIAHEYGFWLEDAFASGGSNGYDHKKLGITARGAWVSVVRHFAERGVDVQSDPVTVVGVGDMSGDVFGNGLLQSRSVKLLAAFNHKHIFIDPDPDPASSYAERARLFKLPGSSWSDYAPASISPGGGVFDRQLKTLTITPQMSDAFGIEAEALTPDELITALLKSSVDLLFNGGIGTYVKASGETHDEVGDRANDHIRVNACDLRAKVVGEGGNLGLTQDARVEFALCGGAVNTDFIDNSGGVDCSDHEVNLKIALNAAVGAGEIDTTERNAVIESLDTEVADLVLANNFLQARALSLAEAQARDRPQEFAQLVNTLEREAALDREIENLPTDEVFSARGFTRPELAVLMAYSKILLKQRLLAADIDAEPLFASAFAGAFPGSVTSAHPGWFESHPLSKEIVATQVANRVIHEMGISFVIHTCDLTSASAADVVRAYWTVRGVFDIDGRFTAATESDSSLSQSDQRLMGLVSLGRRATRWLLKHRFDELGAAPLVGQFKPHVAAWSGELTALLPVVDAAIKGGRDVGATAQIYDDLATFLNFDRLTAFIEQLPVSNPWQAMERDELLDEVDGYRARIAVAVPDTANLASTRDEFVSAWRAATAEDLLESGQDYAFASVLRRQLGGLVDSLT